MQRYKPTGKRQQTTIGRKLTGKRQQTTIGRKTTGKRQQTTIGRQAHTDQGRFKKTLHAPPQTKHRDDIKSFTGITITSTITTIINIMRIILLRLLILRICLTQENDRSGPLERWRAPAAAPTNDCDRQIISKCSP